MLSTRTDRYKRDRALDTLNAWGHDTRTLENSNDTGTRELYARMADHDLWSASNGTGDWRRRPAEVEGGDGESSMTHLASAVRGAVLSRTARGWWIFESDSTGLRRKAHPMRLAPEEVPRRTGHPFRFKAVSVRQAQIPLHLPSRAELKLTMATPTGPSPASMVSTTSSVLVLITEIVPDA